jgi:hypothetical protein
MIFGFCFPRLKFLAIVFAASKLASGFSLDPELESLPCLAMWISCAGANWQQRIEKNRVAKKRYVFIN